MFLTICFSNFCLTAYHQTHLNWLGLVNSLESVMFRGMKAALESGQGLLPFVHHLSSICVPPIPRYVNPCGLQAQADPSAQ